MTFFFVLALSVVFLAVNWKPKQKLCLGCYENHTANSDRICDDCNAKVNARLKKTPKKKFSKKVRQSFIKKKS
jgi:hypothetical protein